MNPRRTAILVDGDNIGSRHATRILAEAARLGRVDVARVYLATHHTTDWSATPGFRVMNAGTAKNAADLHLSVDAMELGLVGGIDAFAIAASDRDYTPLAFRLRERGLHVLGLGEKKAPDEFRHACTEFVSLDTSADARPPAAANGASDLDRKIRTMIAQHSSNGRGMALAELGRKMYVVHQACISRHPERSWRGYLEARPALYCVDPRGPQAMVRFLPAGFAPH